MKKITQEQIKAIIDAFYQCNAPVQMFSALQKTLDSLPTIEEPKSE